MAIVASAKSDERTFEPAPAGVHQAVCVDVIDKGILDVTWQGVTKKQHKIDLAWQIKKSRTDGKPFLVFKRYTLSVSEKANLRKDLQSWLGRDLSRDEEMQFDVEAVIGRNCILNIQHKQSKDRTFANVISVMPLMDGMPEMAGRDYTRVCDRTSENAGGAQSPAHDDDGPPPVSDDDITW